MLNYPAANCRAEINASESISGETALTMAVQAGNLEMVQHLVSNYAADPNRNNEQEVSPLAKAAKFGMESCLLFLLEVGAGADIKICDDKTALIFAAMGDHGGVCHILLEHGVNLESTDREGLSALSWACLKGQRSTAQILLDAGARVSHRDRVGRNPMHLGRVFQNYVDLIFFLNFRKFKNIREIFLQSCPVRRYSHCFFAIIEKLRFT